MVIEPVLYLQLKGCANAVPVIQRYESIENAFKNV